MSSAEEFTNEFPSQKYKITTPFTHKKLKSSLGSEVATALTASLAGDRSDPDESPPDSDKDAYGRSSYADSHYSLVSDRKPKKYLVESSMSSLFDAAFSNQLGRKSIQNMESLYNLTTKNHSNSPLNTSKSFRYDKPVSIKSSIYPNQELSEIESLILRSKEPIMITDNEYDHEEIEVSGQRGMWLNKSEAKAWRGDVPLSNYSINVDANPEIITKHSNQKIEYVQEMAVRYLRPPTPPTPGEIIIKQEKNVLTPPAPPLIIRQQPVRPITPEPLIIREVPPEAPKPIGRKIITISGKRLPPPPRKVIIERY